MIDPFDAEFLSQELRESWKKIEELEQENRKLKDYAKWCDDTISGLIQERNSLENKLGVTEDDIYDTTEI